MSTPARSYAASRMKELVGSSDWTHAGEIQAAFLEGQVFAMREAAGAGAPATRTRVMVGLLEQARDLLRDLPLSLKRQEEAARWQEACSALLRRSP